MIETLLQAILEQIDQPKKDIEKNLRALLNEAVEKMDLVSKQEMALQNANLRLEQLTQQVNMLEETLKNKK